MSTQSNDPTPVAPGRPDGVRARKRRETARRIQDAALRLFERDGFDDVTVEHVAAAAGSSVATVYRYFTTKENLILYDENEQSLTDQIVAAIRSGRDVRAAIEHTLEELPVESAADAERNARTRIRLVSDVPAVAGAAHIRARARAAQLVAAAAERSADALATHVAALSALAALEAAADHWQDNPDAGSLRDLSLAALRILAPSATA